MSKKPEFELPQEIHLDHIAGLARRAIDEWPKRIIQPLDYYCNHHGTSLYEALYAMFLEVMDQQLRAKEEEGELQDMIAEEKAIIEMLGGKE